MEIIIFIVGYLLIGALLTVVGLLRAMTEHPGHDPSRPAVLQMVLLWPFHLPRFFR